MVRNTLTRYRGARSTTPRGSTRATRCWSCSCSFAGAQPAHGLNEISPEEDISDLLATPPRSEAEEVIPGRRWAVLPEFGYGPDTGFEFGGKVTDRDLAGSGITLDVDGLFSLRQYQRFGLSIGSPHLGGDRFVVLLNADYLKDPQREFFGLGNNDVGPDPLSTNLYERIEGLVDVGWRPCPGSLWTWASGSGTRTSAPAIAWTRRPSPSARSRACRGVQGGYVLPLEASLVWNTRDGVVRPTQGWRVIAKVSHTNPVLQSPFRFTISHRCEPPDPVPRRGPGARPPHERTHLSLAQPGACAVLGNGRDRLAMKCSRGLPAALPWHGTRPLNAEYSGPALGLHVLRLGHPLGSMGVYPARWAGFSSITTITRADSRRASPGGSALWRSWDPGSRSPRRSWPGSTWALGMRRRDRRSSPSGTPSERVPERCR